MFWAFVMTHKDSFHFCWTQARVKTSQGIVWQEEVAARGDWKHENSVLGALMCYIWAEVPNHKPQPIYGELR